jgi:catechol 2,3-dioxygenase-like lactoylglutathione lyase family enzyme
MNIKGISWLGVGTARFEETFRFFTDVLGLPVADREGEVVMLRAAESQIVEIFGPGSRTAALTSPPVVAFEVDDVAAARAELDRNGVELIGDIGVWNGFQWQYFRGPEGYVFAVKKTPPPGWEAA